MAIEIKTYVPLNPLAAKPTSPIKEATAKPKVMTATMPVPTPQVGKRRGPKPSGNAKKLLSLRLDPEVIDGFKATGDGWQARINDALRRHLGL